jgi:hypothetical protein
LSTLNIKNEFKQLKSLTGIEIFDGGFEPFCAIGDENGLFICINKKVKYWYPTNYKAFSSEFEIRLLEKANEYRIAYKN